MTQVVDLTTPVGRLVQGSLYDYKTTNAKGEPLVYKTGQNIGQPRTEFYLAIAIEKKGEAHWKDTEWGAKIYQVGVQSWPQGQWQHPDFAWKVEDGDSTIPNKKGKRNCEFEGFPGHWVIRMSNGFAPNVYNEDGTQQLTEPNVVKLGDYIQVYCLLKSNGSHDSPGIFINQNKVAFTAYGERIVLGIDPKDCGFGRPAQLPAGASLTPVSAGFNPAPVNATPLPPVGATPHTGILNPPVQGMPPMPPVPPTPPMPQRVMLPAANGIPYESWIANKWSDQQLIEAGYMQP